MTYSLIEVTHLTPDQHGAEDNLQSIKEIVPNDYDCSSPCGPSFTRANGFDTRCCYFPVRVSIEM